MSPPRVSNGASELATWHIEVNRSSIPTAVSLLAATPATRRHPHALPFGAVSTALDPSVDDVDVAPSRVPFYAAATQVSGVMGLRLAEKWMPGEVHAAASSAGAIGGAQDTSHRRTAQLSFAPLARLGARGQQGAKTKRREACASDVTTLRGERVEGTAVGPIPAVASLSAVSVVARAAGGGVLLQQTLPASDVSESSSSSIKGRRWPAVKVRVRMGQAATKLVSGAVAGGVSRTVTAPLETIRTHLMVGGASSSSFGQVFRQIMKADGWRGLFRGNGIQVLRCAPSRAIELYTYESVKCALSGTDASPPALPFPLPLPASSIAGAAAGMASTLLCYPLELLKTRITVRPNVYRGLRFAFSKIVREQGVRELYRGVVPSVFGIIPYAGANYCFYDSLCAAYRRATNKERMGHLATLAVGSTAGAMSSACTFPFEVAREKMQMGALNGGREYLGLWHCLQTIAREEGVRGLFRGVVPSCLKLMPAAGISFMCYEAMKRVINEAEDENKVV